MESKFIRAFFALPISPDCREKLQSIEQNLKEILPTGIRWVNTNNLHVTLKFLGKFDSKLIPKFINFLETDLSTIGKFILTFHNLGVFPNKQKPNVIWAGLDNPIELINIFRKIENVANELGYPKEKRGFLPHITIGRIKIDASHLLEIGSTVENMGVGKICQSLVDRIVFYQSDLTQSGPVYSELFQLPLKQ